MHSARKAAPLLGLAALAGLGLAARPAQAAPTVFDLTYSGVPDNNNASATGTVTLDPTLLASSGTTYQPSIPFVSAFSLTVTGAATGNGTFTFTDYAPTSAALPGGGFLFFTQTAPLDFTRQLVGQSGFGDFNIFENAVGQTANAPTAFTTFTIGTSNGPGDLLTLTSFAPAPLAAVPEPSTVAPFAFAALGLLGLTLHARRKSPRPQ